MIRSRPALSLPPVLAARAASARDARRARSSGNFNLLHPVPGPQLRELSADRPDKTESACRVDAGHFRPEADFFNDTRDQAHGTMTAAWNIASFNLKADL